MNDQEIIAELEKEFKKVWRKYGKILIEEREARKIFESGYRVAVRRFTENKLEVERIKRIDSGQQANPERLAEDF